VASSASFSGSSDWYRPRSRTWGMSNFPIASWLSTTR
jgi:hypothetical protein